MSFRQWCVRLVVGSAVAAGACLLTAGIFFAGVYLIFLALS